MYRNRYLAAFAALLSVLLLTPSVHATPAHDDAVTALESAHGALFSRLGKHPFVTAERLLLDVDLREASWRGDVRDMTRVLLRKAFATASRDAIDRDAKINVIHFLVDEENDRYLPQGAVAAAARWAGKYNAGVCLQAMSPREFAANEYPHILDCVLSWENDDSLWRQHGR